MNPKKLNQEEWLLTSCPKKITSISSIKDIEYNGTAKSKMNLYSKIEIAKKITRHKQIQINCLIDSFSIENTLTSLENSEEKIDIKPTRSKKK